MPCISRAATADAAADAPGSAAAAPGTAADTTAGAPAAAGVAAGATADTTATAGAPKRKRGNPDRDRIAVLEQNVVSLQTSLQEEHAARMAMETALHECAARLTVLP